MGSLASLDSWALACRSSLRGKPLHRSYRRTPFPPTNNANHLVSSISPFLLKIASCKRLPSMQYCGVSKKQLRSHPRLSALVQKKKPFNTAYKIFDRSCFYQLPILIAAFVHLSLKDCENVLSELVSDQFRISPADSPEIFHHTVWRTWLFIAYSDERWLYNQFSLPHLYISL